MPADLLPPNATRGERAMSLATARIGDVPMPVGTLWNPDTCPAGLLPWLAWALSVDGWSTDWTETQKREAIRASIEVHRRKGTLGALKRALQALGYDVTVDENTGEVHTFRLRINVTNQSLPDEVYDQAENVAVSVANTRSKLIAVDALAKSTGEIHVLAAAYDGTEGTVLPDVITAQTVDGQSPFVGGAVLQDADIVLG